MEAAALAVAGFSLDPHIAGGLASSGGREPSFAASLISAKRTLQTLAAEGVLSRGDIEGRRVLDWECGAGAFSALFLAHGARAVTAIDTWLELPRFQALLGSLAGLTFERIGLQPFCERGPAESGIDLIFANTVTEHLAELPAVFALCNGLLAPGGLMVLNHDNYYQPVGSHDHGFLFYGEKGTIEFQGVRCWERREKCEASGAHRAELAKRFPWTWDERMERRLTPDDCGRCPYFLRGQPWSHLLNQSAFRWIYPQVAFSTGYPESSLNKATPFQLRQFLVEAGFDIETWAPHRVSNEVPAPLLEAPFFFRAEELRTTTIAMRCRKAGEPLYASAKSGFPQSQTNSANCSRRASNTLEETASSNTDTQNTPSNGFSAGSRCP